MLNVFLNVFLNAKHVQHVYKTHSTCFEKMCSILNFASNFHMDLKVVCNDEAIIQKPLPRASESAQFGLDQMQKYFHVKGNMFH